jgi:hypothetical protein
VLERRNVGDRARLFAARHGLPLLGGCLRSAALGHGTELTRGLYDDEPQASTSG